MAFKTPTRRAFLATTGLLCARAALPDQVFPSAWAHPGGTPSPPPITRKDARDLPPDEAKKYAEAFRRVKVRGPERPEWKNGRLVLPDRTSTPKNGYAYQAMLHTDHCTHGNWWFLPWHRAYLFYFEQILRAAVADYLPGVPLAIPYWNWTDDPTIPTLFNSGADNPLADDRRFSEPLDENDVGPNVIQQTVTNASSFESFGSSPACRQRQDAGASGFEAGPHGVVHVKVGGVDPDGLPGTMTIVPTSAFDPIFWSHHANIDRLWDVWRGLPGHLDPAFDTPCPDGTVTWGGLEFSEFVDSDGKPIKKTVQQILTDPAVAGVRYVAHRGELLVANRPAGARLKPLEIAATPPDKTPSELRLAKSLTLSLSFPEAGREKLMAAVGTVPTPPVLFRVENVKVPSPQPQALVRVFLDKPDADERTSLKDPHYVGYFTFFGGHDEEGHEHAKGHSGRNFVVNLGPALHRLHTAEKLRLDQPLHVTLVVVPLTPKVRGSLERVTVPLTGGKLVLE